MANNFWHENFWLENMTTSCQTSGHGHEAWHYYQASVRHICLCHLGVLPLCRRHDPHGRAGGYRPSVAFGLGFSQVLHRAFYFGTRWRWRSRKVDVYKGIGCFSCWDKEQKARCGGWHPLSPRSIGLLSSAIIASASARGRRSTISPHDDDPSLASFPDHDHF